VVLVATLVTIACALYFVCREKRAERNKMIACLLLILVSIGFWALYNQTFSSLMLFAERNMSTGFLGFHIDAEFTQFFNPFWIFVFSPILSKVWITLSRRKRNPGAPLKFALGIACIAMGFYALAVGVSYYHTADGMVDPWWLALSYLIQTLGELLLSPIGLAMITTLSPSRYIGMMMGVWFLAQSSAFAISGGLAAIASAPAGISAAISLPIYTHAFYVYGNIALALTIVALLMVPFLNRLIQGKVKLTFARAQE
jgi:POT family proton-dependent oligopeptide transporter